jgi:hypothetical protein
MRPESAPAPAAPASAPWSMTQAAATGDTALIAGSVPHGGQMPPRSASARGAGMQLQCGQHGGAGFLALGEASLFFLFLYLHLKEAVLFPGHWA